MSYFLSIYLLLKATCQLDDLEISRKVGGLPIYKMAGRAAGVDTIFSDCKCMYSWGKHNYMINQQSLYYELYIWIVKE